MEACEGEMGETPVTGGAYIVYQQRIVYTRGCAHAEGNIVAACASSPSPGGVHFVQVGDEDHADDDSLVDAEGDGDCDKGVAMDEVGGAC